MYLSLKPEFWRLALSTIGARKRAWIFTVVASTVIPFIDVAVTGSVYLIFSDDKRSALFLKIQEYSKHVELVNRETVLIQQIVVLAVGVLFVLFSLLLKYRNQLIVGELREFFAVEDSQRLIGGYLASPTQTVRQVSKERVTSSILQDCGSREQYCRILVNLGAAGVGLMLYGIGALVLSWQTVVAVCVIYLLPFVLTRKIYGLIEQLSKKQIKLRERVIHQVGEVSQSIERVRVDGLEEYVEDQTLKTVSKQKRRNLDVVRTKARFSAIFDGFGQLQLLIVVFVCTAVIGQPVETLLVLVIVFAKLQGYFGRITGGLQSFKIAGTKVERYESLMKLIGDTEYELVVEERAETIDKIELRGVSFSYQENQHIFRNVNLELKLGDRILLSGPSGVGKSTLLEVLGGLLAPDSGEVLFNDEECTNKVFRKYRSQICFVTPNVYVFDGSLRYNLSPNREIAEDELWNVLENVDLADFANEQEMGLDAKVGPNGSLLSTGQRQRLVLARAFVQRPRIFILDEFTANLDQKTENRIMHLVNQLAGRDTITIMAAHKVPSGFCPTSHFSVSPGKVFQQKS